MVERQETALKLLVSHQQLSEAVEPAVGHFDDPAPGFLPGVTFEFAGLLPTPFDMGDVAVLVMIANAGAPV